MHKKLISPNNQFEVGGKENTMLEELKGVSHHQVAEPTWPQVNPLQFRNWSHPGNDGSSLDHNYAKRFTESFKASSIQNGLTSEVCLL